MQVLRRADRPTHGASSLRHDPAAAHVRVNDAARPTPKDT
jgi:hypothetical protein